jgi:acyl transferase domain-containing protein/NADP-dependent 3-hydroxy acid dehydrogenase YdfG
VKSNLGHAQAAAGVAGVIKMVMAMRHSVLPRTLHADEPSAQVDWDAAEVRLLTSAVSWPAGDRPRRAGVSSFGISGTNAHLILEEPPAEPAPEPAGAGSGPAGLGAVGAGAGSAGGCGCGGEVVVWRVSGASAAGLRGQAGRLAGFVAGGGGGCAGAVAAGRGRRAALRYRLAVAGAGRAELAAGLEAFLAGTEAGGAGGAVAGGAVAGGAGAGPGFAVAGDGGAAGAVVCSGVARAGRKVVFVFPGQGWQWPGMAADLLECSPVFAAAAGECSAAVQALAGFSVLDVLARREGAPGLDRVEVVQPVMFSVMVALAALWQAAGVVPAAVVGHSQGEIAAACVAGALTVAQAAAVVVTRSAALAALAGTGAMASVAAGPARAAALIAGRPALAIAAVNSPAATVVSGPPAAITALLADCDTAGIRARRLAVDYASHSAHIEPVAAALLAGLDGLAPAPAAIAVHSTLTGQQLDTTTMTARYWYDNLRRTVQFDTATRNLLRTGHDTFIEISAHPVLTPALHQIADTTPSRPAIFGTLHRDHPGPAAFTTATATAWTHGLPAAPPDRHRPCPPATTIPTYAFDHHHYWLRNAGGQDPSDIGLAATGHDLIAAAAELAGDGSVLLAGRVSLATQPWLADHQVDGVTLLPGSAFADLVIRAGDQVGCGRLEELLLSTPLTVPDRKPVDLQVHLDPPDEDGRRMVSVHSRPAGGSAWTQHAAAVVTQSDPPADDIFLGMATWPPAGAEAIGVDGFYGELARRGYRYGPAFQGLAAAWRRGGEIFAEVELPERVAERVAGFGLHPVLLDAAAHAIALGDQLADGLWLPFSWRDASLYATGATRARVRVSPAGTDSVAITIADPDGRPVAFVGSITARRIAPRQLAAAVRRSTSNGLYHLEWVPVTIPEAGRRLSAAVLGPDPLGLSSALGVPRHDSVADLAGGIVPDHALITCVTEAEQAGDHAAAARGITRPLLRTVRDWLADDRVGRCRLVVITEGAAAAGDPHRLDLPAAAAWGLIRTAQAEHPDRFALIDLDSATPLDAGQLISALAGSDGEPQLALRGGRTLAARLVRSAPADLLDVGPLSARPDGWRVDALGGGTLDDVGVVESARAHEPLDDDQVLVRVRAAGINFYDVAVCLGMVPNRDGIGGEGAGEVLRVGAGVRDFAPGDQVMGVFTGAFGPLAVADRRKLAAIPRGWSVEQAAAVPAAFCTAYYALTDLAGLTEGQSVLVHSAAGGVGSAAVQLARHLGARVFATASQGKWDYLRSLGIPADHIASSRTTEFADQFLAVTGGTGVDVVLGSLSGDMVDASLRLLSSGGRYIEMGKTDVRDAALVRAAHPGVTYQAFDLAGADPGRVRAMLGSLATLFADGALRPPPVKVWDLAQAREALRFMSLARHVGKNVLRIPRPIDPDGTVLVTGGTGTLGGIIARHLAGEHGVRHLLLLSRQGQQAAGASELRDDLAGLGAQVTMLACDTADRESLARALGHVRPEHPLTAVVHTAGALADAPVATLTSDQLEAVLRPKADTALHLHDLTSDRDLAAFVLFSSAAGIFGSHGQAGYGAANALLDALAHDRHRQGRCASSIAWGLWARASGLTGTLASPDLARMARSGVAPLPDDEGIALFDAAVQHPYPVHVAARLDLRVSHADPLWRRLAAPSRPTAGSDAALGPALAEQLKRLTPAQRRQRLQSHVCASMGAILCLDPAGIDLRRGFLAAGLDSLTGTELRNRLSASTGLRLPATVIFDHPTPDALAGYLDSLLSPDGATQEDQDTAQPLLADLNRLDATLSAVSLKDAARAEVTTRLRAMLSRLNANGSTGDVADRLGSATAEEIFSFIDQELS